MFTGFSHIMMWANDMERAHKWYIEKLGCVENFAHLPHYASLRLDDAGIRIDLHPTGAEGKDVGHGPTPYFQVADVAASLKTFTDKDVKVGEIQNEGGHVFATIWDSEGNALGLA